MIGCLFSGWALFVNAHEYWVSPSAYTLEASDRLIVNLRNGEDFKGNFLPFNPPTTARFEVHAKEGSAKLGKTIGDKPASSVIGLPDGLVTVLYQSKNEAITYDDEMKFRKFASAHDFSNLLGADKMKLPIKEKYFRYAKMLVSVGSGAGSDRAYGLEYELIALTNPYIPAGRETMTFELRYQGSLVSNRQVEIFEKPVGTNSDTKETQLQTDANGRLKFQVKPGFEYLVNSVLLRKATEKADWVSHWASATFAIPAL